MRSLIHIIEFRIWSIYGETCRAITVDSKTRASMHSEKVNILTITLYLVWNYALTSPSQSTIRQRKAEFTHFADEVHP